jgi:hypothetical protein
LNGAGSTGVATGTEVVVIGGVSWPIGNGFVELTGFGLSLEHPTVNEQAIRSAAKISVLVLSKLFFVEFAFA